MNENNNIQLNNSQTTDVQGNTIDYSTSSAEVIGELRKDKIGRPILVAQMFLIFGIVLIALPIGSNLLENESSFLYKMLHKNDVIVDTPVDPGVKSEFTDGTQPQTLNRQTSMKGENLVMSNFYLKGNTITCDMYSYNSVMNLDEKNLFLEVSAARNAENVIAAVKLTGTYDSQKQTVSFQAYGLSFNGNLEYVGKIVSKETKDFPNIELDVDEAGIGMLSCELDNRTIDYTFKNGYLINIQDTVKVKFNDQKDNNTYLNVKKTYEDKASKLGNMALVEEVADGFNFNANIDLENNSLPSNVGDYNYFKGDTEAKIIDYTMKGKGFDCR